MNNTNTDNGFFSNFFKPNKLGNEARKILMNSHPSAVTSLTPTI